MATLSSMTTALQIMKSGQAGSAAPLPLQASSVAASRAAASMVSEGAGAGSTSARLAAEAQNGFRDLSNDPAFREMMSTLDEVRDGTLSPTSERATKYQARAVGEEFLRDPRMLEIGHFVPAHGAAYGVAVEHRDAAFPDRNTAMVNAYHWGKQLSESAQFIAKVDRDKLATRAAIQDLTARIGAGDGDVDAMRAELTGREASLGYLGEEVSRHRLQADRVGASLARQFSFRGQGMTVTAGGTTEATGFTITHGTQGKVMEVGADGTLTLFDASGKGYTPSEYNAARPDGLVAELHNDGIRRADEAAPVAEKLQRIHESAARFEAYMRSGVGLDLRR